MKYIVLSILVVNQNQSKKNNKLPKEFKGCIKLNH